MLKFKTNIKCGGCIATVTPFLNDQKNITSWEVDTTTVDKVLTVVGDATAEDVIDALKNAGFKAEKI